jgi:iron complex transport system ATP-binding protein
VPPFSAVDDAAAEEAVELMRVADVVVVVDAPFGPGNVANLRAALRARAAGARILLVEQVPVRERDFTGGEATRLWEELSAGAERVSSLDALLAAAR